MGSLLEARLVGPDRLQVVMNADPFLAFAALTLMPEQDSPRDLPLDLPEDPLARLELVESFERVNGAASALAQANCDDARQALLTWASARPVEASGDTVWAWAQAFNGTYTRLRSAALAREGCDIEAGEPASVDMDAELARMLGQDAAEAPDGVDGQGWDLPSALFASLSHDLLEALDLLG